MQGIGETKEYLVDEDLKMSKAVLNSFRGTVCFDGYDFVCPEMLAELRSMMAAKGADLLELESRCGEGLVYGLGRKVYKFYRKAFELEKDRQWEIDLQERFTQLQAMKGQISSQVVIPSRLIHLAIRSGKVGVAGHVSRYIKGAMTLAEAAGYQGQKEGIDKNDLLKLLEQLYQLLTDLHNNDIIVGDLKAENVLVKGRRVFLVDTLGMGLPGKSCSLYTAYCTDPRILEEEEGQLRLKTDSRLSKQSDKYAFHYLLFQVLAGCAPFSGVPFDETNSALNFESERQLREVSIMDSAMLPPSTGVPEALGPKLYEHLYWVFQRGNRPDFPKDWFRTLRFIKCSKCSLEYEQSELECPICSRSTMRHIRRELQELWTQVPNPAGQ